ncbi:MAG: prephenate dehydrogenase/arogenate dehydrogenase family protein [Aquisalimonadaceae bacterium]
MSSAPPPIARLCVIGVGLIGGSLAQAVRRAGHVGEIVGCGRGTANLERAVKLGVIDRFETDPVRAVAGADLVMLAVPLRVMSSLMGVIGPHLDANTVLTDAGSAKGSVVDAARASLGAQLPRFVPGHPIAGTEKSGVDAAFPELYQGRRVILTPLDDTDPDAVEQVAALWRAAGASVSEMAVDHHDEVLAATSHLPHVLAYALVDSLSRWSDRDEIFRYAAGGFRDFTRIASSDPEMWRDICLANSDALVAALERYTGDLQQLTNAVRNLDGERLKTAFSNARSARERFLAMLEG